MQIVPALYIKDQKAAVYRPGDYDNIEFLDEDPYELLERLSIKHINRVYIIDVDASLPGDNNNAGLLGSLSNTCVIDLEVGGGIEDMEYLKSLQYAGVDYFVLGTSVIRNFDFLTEIAAADHVKNDRIQISLDVMEGQLFVHGWTEAVSDITPKELIYKCINAGFSRFIITDISKDIDQNRRPDFDLYRDLVGQYPGAKIGAAGRIHTLEDVEELGAIGVAEVIVGNRIYKEEGLIERIAEFNASQKEEEA